MINSDYNDGDGYPLTPTPPGLSEALITTVTAATTASAWSVAEAQRTGDARPPQSFRR